MIGNDYVWEKLQICTSRKYWVLLNIVDTICEVSMNEAFHVLLILTCFGLNERGEGYSI